MIGLRDDTDALSASGYTPARQAAGSRRFRDRYGMPFAAAPRARPGRDRPRLPRGRRDAPARTPGASSRSMRALAFAWFNTPLLLDEDDAIAAALAGVDGHRRAPPSSRRSTRPR